MTYRVIYLTAGWRTILPGAYSLPDAIKQFKRLKKKAFTTWVEDESGTFVPVKGSLRRPKSLDETRILKKVHEVR